MEGLSYFVILYLMFLFFIVVMIAAWILFKRWIHRKRYQQIEKRKHRFHSVVTGFLHSHQTHPPRMRFLLEGPFRRWALQQLVMFKEKNLAPNHKFMYLLSSWGYDQQIEDSLQDHSGGSGLKGCIWLLFLN
jgi:hypothetical protein